MPVFYDFFRKFKFSPGTGSTGTPIVADTTIEADSVTDTATIEAGQNIVFSVDDTLSIPGDPRTSTDKVIISAPDYTNYVPLGTSKIRLEKSLGGTATTSSEIEFIPDPASPITIIGNYSNGSITIGANSPTLPFSQEQIEDLSASLLTNGTHTELTVTYQDNGSFPNSQIPDTTSGSGIGAVFDIAIINNTYTADITTPGLNYAVGNTVTFFGSNFPGGTSPANNLVATVGVVDGTGGILSLSSVTGTPPLSDNIDLAVTSTLQTVSNRGASTSNTITISNATGSSDISTGALKLTAGGLAVFENANIGGYVKATTLQSTQTTGTAPLTVASTTMVTNLQAETASKWHTARTVTFTGDVTGSFSIDGSADVSNVSLTVGSNTVTLGTDTTGNYVAVGATSGNGLSGSTNSEGSTFTVSSNATALNTAETIVFRDASGNFSAGTITASITGNVSGNAGTVTNGFYTTSSFNLGTTSIAVNRASAAQSLTGITSIDGYAGGLAGGNSTTLLGSIPYQSSTNQTSLLSPNTTANKRFLRMTGTGTNGAAPAWDSITATDVGLGNVTNESKATMFASPTFTGTVSGVTATMVGLGNVTNESKATMFTNPSFTGPAYGNSSTTTDADAVVDAATTSLYAYVVGTSNATRTIAVTNLTAGRIVVLYLRNIQLNPKLMNIAVSTTTTGFSSVNMSKGDVGGLSQQSVTLAGNGGTAVITLFNANGVFCGSIG